MIFLSHWLTRCVSLLCSVASSLLLDLCCLDLSPPVPPPDYPVHRFAGRTVTSGSLVLVTVATKEEGAAQLTVNCEKMVIGTMLVKDILQALTQWREPALQLWTPPPPVLQPSLTYHLRLVSVASPASRVSEEASTTFVLLEEPQTSECHTWTWQLKLNLNVFTWLSKNTNFRTFWGFFSFLEELIGLTGLTFT